jgi:hypothetical protein
MNKEYNPPPMKVLKGFIFAVLLTLFSILLAVVIVRSCADSKELEKFNERL